jgi:inner membrane protein
MDPFTHALSGALVARATAPARGAHLPLRLRMAAGCAAALFPDIDFALRLVGTLTYLNQHQGITHSLLLLPLWTLLLAALFATLARRGADWRLFLAPVALGLLVHIAGDIVTAYGLQLFAPLSSARHALPLVFVVDPVVTGILVAGLLLALRAGRMAALAGLAGVLAYMGFLAIQHHTALDIARGNAPAGAHVTALPQPLSPFNWMLIVEDGDSWRVARVNLRRHADAPAHSWLPGIFGDMQAAHGDAMPPHWRGRPRFGDGGESAFARAAWESEAARPLRNFARYPFLLEVTTDAARRCAHFADLRFDLPALGPSFRFAVCAADTGDWELVRTRGRFWID